MQPRPAFSLSDYWTETRQPAFNWLMVVGLLAIYEAGIALSGTEQRNAADYGLKWLISALGPTGHLAYLAALLGGVLIAAAHHWKRQRPFLPILPLFSAEAIVYALALAPAVLWLRRPFLGGGEDYLLNIGAGVYEEIVFRFLLIRIPLALLQLDPWRVFAEGIAEKRAEALRLLLPVGAIVLVSALLFAAYHHYGPASEPISASVFAFRTLAGLLLTAIYLARGLAMAVWVHALYDVLVHLTAA